MDKIDFYVIYIDAIDYSVRDNGMIVKKAAYVILGLTCDGHKKILSVAIGENERANVRLNALNELKNRGVQESVLTGLQASKRQCLAKN